MKTSRYHLKRAYLLPLVSLLLTLSLPGQEEGLKYIDIQDLQRYMQVLSSDSFAGRATTEPGLQKAADYISGELKRMQIPAAGNRQDYYQRYGLITRKYNTDSCRIVLNSPGGTEEIGNGDFYLFPFPEKRVEISGDIVFAGYGISSSRDGFDEYGGIDIKDRILIVMDGAPVDGDGNSRIKNVAVKGYFRFFSKAMTAQKAGARAVIYVYPPGSKYTSLLDEYSMFSSFTSGTVMMEGDEDTGGMSFLSGYTTSLVFTAREVAEKMLEGTGHTLAELQSAIDTDLKPKSFVIPGKTLSIRAVVREEHLKVPNIAAFIEGSDPVLRNEVIIYSAHFDHVGTRDQENIFNGADDNATGSTALLELAEAYSKLHQKPKRSIMFLWVSGEEIGLFGSKYYSDNPLVPLEKTVTVINLDMVGRVKSDADTGSSVHMTTRESLFVIGGHQSKELLEINNMIFDRVKLTPDYTLSDLNHPEMLYYRSDHINFARKDIPVLFFTTGIHADYHTVRDTWDRIDFDKLHTVTRLVYLLGYELANRPGRIVVDNPFSQWE